MKFTVTNKGVVLYPADEFESDQVEDLVEETTYLVEGAQFSSEYAMGFWDGRVRLIKKLGKRGDRWSAPVGLLAELLDAFPGATVEDKRRRPEAALPLRLDPGVIPSLRPYQSEALRAILEPCGLETGKGLLRLPTRSGKTVIAGAAIAELGHRALFVVNSEMLLDQTVRFFRKAITTQESVSRDLSTTLGDLPLVGQWGSGVLEPGWITVASVQSITTHLTNPAGSEKREGVEQLLATCDVVFFDECHHLEGDEWRRAMTDADASYKIGLSATIFFDRKHGTPKSSIWLRGATGPVIYSLTPSDLIDQGWLCRPHITFHSAPDPGFDVDGSWVVAYRDGVVENEHRNRLICDVVKSEVEAGARTLVTLKQIKHVNILEKMLSARGIRVGVVIGKTKLSKRNEHVESLRKREIDVLIGTVFGEAVDIPFLETVVIGDGMASKVLTMQRLRNLTPCGPDDKPRLEPMDPAEVVRVHDFADTCHKVLRNHSRERLRTYRKNRAFKVSWEQGGSR